MTSSPLQIDNSKSAWSLVLLWISLYCIIANSYRSSYSGNRRSYLDHCVVALNAYDQGWHCTCRQISHLHESFRVGSLRGASGSLPEVVAPNIFIFGLGYVGIELADELQQVHGWRVCGTSTNALKTAALQKRGFTAYTLDEKGSVDASEALERDLLSSSHVLSTVPPSLEAGNTDVVLRRFSGLLKKAATSGSLKWLGYCSSTGVYGDRCGEWVTEAEELRPTNAKTAARVAAEMQWQSLHEMNQLPVHIFRLSGIYGPERNALETLRRAGGDIKQCGVNDHEYTSRIHVSDIVTCLRASMGRPSPGEIYNVADDFPCTKYEVSCCDVDAYAPALLLTVLFRCRGCRCCLMRAVCWGSRCKKL